MKYIPLNIKTEYDLMNSLIKLDDLFSYAKNNGIDTIGITDTNMFGDYEFINKCKNNNIKPIIGIEINNILIYARNYDGYVALCKIVSKKNIYDDLDIDYIYKFDSDIILVVNYNDYSNYDKFTHVYVGYKNENEKRNALLITKDIVYIPLFNINLFVTLFNIRIKISFVFISIVCYFIISSIWDCCTQQRFIILQCLTSPYNIHILFCNILSVIFSYICIIMMYCFVMEYQQRN